MATSVGMICFVAAALFSGCCSAQTIVGPSGKPLQPTHRAKCSQSPTGCYEQATRDCRGGSFQILDRENHAGGFNCRYHSRPGYVVHHELRVRPL
jgi:hypothetical protein